MPGHERDFSGAPPTPVIGLVVAGTLFLLIEGILEIAILDLGASYGLSIPASTWAIPGFTILLVAVLFVFVWVYWDRPSWGLGAIFIVLGVVSFIVGAGFLVGGILVIIGGALACFADWVLVLVSGRMSRVPTTGPSTPEGPSTVEPVSRFASSLPVIVYRRCPSCGELNRRELTVCEACGKPTGP